MIEGSYSHREPSSRIDSYKSRGKKTTSITACCEPQHCAVQMSLILCFQKPALEGVSQVAMKESALFNSIPLQQKIDVAMVVQFSLTTPHPFGAGTITPVFRSYSINHGFVAHTTVGSLLISDHHTTAFSSLVWSQYQMPLHFLAVQWFA